MKYKIFLTILIFTIIAASCSNDLFVSEGRWNPNDPEYDASTDPNFNSTEGPAVPGRLSAVLSESAVIAALEWQDNSSTEDNFNIYRKVSTDTEWTKIGAVAADTVTYTDSGFSLGVKYQYRVKAINENGESEASNIAEIEIPAEIITVTLSSAVSPATKTSPVPITITFSEAVTGFEQSDVTVTNASVTSFDTASNPVFELELTPVDAGTDCVISVTIPEGAASNASDTITQPSDTFTIDYDVTAPGAPGTPALIAADDTGESDSDGLTLKDSNITLTGITAADTAAVIIMDSTDTTELGSASSSPGETYSILLGGPLSEGANELHAYSVDAAGNRSSLYSTYTVSLDTTVPVEPVIISPYRGQYYPHTTGINTITAEWTTTDADIWKYNLRYGTSQYFSGATEANDITATSYYFAPPSGFANSKLYFSVQAVDSAGNTSEWSYFSKDNPDTTYCHFDKEHDSLFGDEFAGFIASYGSNFRYYYSDYTTGDIVYEPIGHSGDNADFIGDFNGDGYPDLAVADYSARHIYIYFGVASGTLDWSLEYSVDIDGSGWGGGNINQLGASLDGCDINGDGYDDLIIGAPDYLTDYGAVFIVTGRQNPAATINSATLYNKASTQEYGFSVSRAGDINKDGFADIIIGAPSADTADGRAYIRLGSSNAPSTFNEYILYTPATGEGLGFGSVTSFGGDINDDGYDDFLIGTAQIVGGGEGYLYYGNTIGAISEPDATWTAGGSETFYGICGGGNFDNDADNMDVVISLNNGSTGEIQVFFGGNIDSTFSTPDYTINNSTTDHSTINSSFGTQLCELKDLDGIGHCDIIINEPTYNNGTANGRIWIENGRGADSPWSTMQETIEADTANDVGLVIH